jgi:glutamate carboxypeptidase
MEFTDALLDQAKIVAQRLLPEALDWLQRMVEINSFTENATGVTQLAELTEACFAPLGFQATRVPSDHPAHGPHLFLQRGPTEQPPILLVTHLDTVFPPEEERANDFHWKPDGPRVYGPGTVDNKGGTVMIWLMLRVLAEVLPQVFEHTNWLVAANAAEEVIGSDFATAAAQQCGKNQARLVLVFEGGPVSELGWHLVTARKGRREFRLTCHGRAAHAGSQFEQGINAILELTQLFPKLAAIHESGAQAQELTFNLATLQGGTVLNRVPHLAKAEAEARAFDPQLLTALEAQLAALSGPTARGAHITVECIGRTQAWPGGTGTQHLFDLWQQQAARLGRTLHPQRRGGLSDANYLHHLGPTLDGLGPVGENAHCSEWSADGSKRPEYVEPGSFVEKALLNLLGITASLRHTTPL